MSECTAPAYRAIFFDLDGTLLPMEIDEFMRTYFEALGAYVARFGVAPEAFMAGMKAGDIACGVAEILKEQQDF